MLAEVDFSWYWVLKGVWHFGEWARVFFFFLELIS